jgi:hypothetical protein
MASAQEEFNELMRDKGHRVSHPEDDDDRRSSLDPSDEEDHTPSGSQQDEDDQPAPRPSVSSYRSTIPTTRYQANTGVKGVIADAQHWQDSCRDKRASARSVLNLSSQTQTLTLDHSAPASHLPSLDEDEDGMFDDLDDDFMDQWRKSRMQELQSGPKQSKSQADFGSGGLFGGMVTVDGDGFLEAVDNSQGAVVVVYIYDEKVSREQTREPGPVQADQDKSDVSTEIERCLRKLAGKHQDTRFIKLHFEDAQMEPAGVPALLAYRNGEKFAGLIPIIDELPDDADLSSTVIEAVLQRYHFD